eukprot:4195081-Prymnesium_polylepis.1
MDVKLAVSAERAWAVVGEAASKGYGPYGAKHWVSLPTPGVFLLRLPPLLDGLTAPQWGCYF